MSFPFVIAGLSLLSSVVVSCRFLRQQPATGGNHDLGNGLDAQPKTTKIQEEINKFVFFGGGSKQGATFTRYDRDNENIEFYFTA